MPPKIDLWTEGYITGLSDSGLSYRDIKKQCASQNICIIKWNQECNQTYRECINRVCEAAGLKTADKKKKVDKRVLRMLGDTADMRNAGQDVTLCINSETLTLTSLDEGTLVAQHDMPNISFASGGDPDTLDFVAYVAKDRLHGRCCWVLECCGRNSAQDVITTIGQAFELRFKECLKRTPRQEGPGPIVFNGAVGGDAAREVKVIRDDPEYYNDLPGKVPPGPDAPPVPPLPDYNSPSSTLSSRSSEVTVIPGNLREDASSQRPNRESIGNLIDLTTEAIPANHPVHDYVNDCMAPQQREHSDPFDIPPPELGVSARMAVPPKPLPPSQRSQLEAEGWFHGPISRREAEQKLSVDGDFLVRESQGSPGQYVLTGMQAGVKKHLLLVDPEGVVRTKDRTYESVSHLISYHRDNGLPIISAESALLLKSPVMRQPVPR